MGIDIDQLMNLKITSVSKKSERFFEAPAAVYVLTNDEIRRSGMRSVPELLRMVPGIQVARHSGNRWAITARGFNGLFADKVLVMIDGRSVYSPLFAGVYWDAQDVLMEDIDRIEVIRGPGATIWGANAVNGVINIVTRLAKDGQGLYLSGGGGNVERGFAELRYGGALGEDVHYSAYFKWFERTAFVSRDGQPANDATDALRGGAKLDWQITDDDLLLIHGDAYGGDSNSSVQQTTIPPPGQVPPSTAVVPSRGSIQGGNVLTRWEHTFGADHAAHLQFYYDRADRADVQLGYRRNTLDLELQHRFPFLRHGEFTWGFEWRRNFDDSDSTDTVTLDPKMRTDDLVSGLLQAEWRAFDDLLRLTAGSKLEWNDYTGFEYQPSGRIAVVPNDRNTVWMSVSRAVRTPSRSDEDVTITAVPAPVFGFQIRGNRDVVSEVVVAYEAGYRVQPVDRLELDLAGFYNDYDYLLNSDPTPDPFCLYGGVVDDTPPPPSCPTNPPAMLFNPVMLVNQLQNSLTGSTWGIELSGRWSVLEDWMIIERFSIDAAYSYLDITIDTSQSSDANAGLEATSSPQHQVNTRFHLDFPFDLSFDTSIYWVDRLPQVVVAEGVPAYFRLDFRWGWFATEHIEASVVLQNATNASHQEWVTQQGVIGTDIPRSVYGQLTFRY
jgi:iron complex outermembrane receptor protein